MKIYVSKSEDRDAMCVILARNGYTIRQGLENRNPSDKRRSAYVEIVDPARIAQEEETT